MSDSSAIRAGRAFVELFADSSKLDATLKQVRRNLKDFGNMVAGWGKGMMAAGALITAPLVAAAKITGEIGETFSNMAKRTGASVEALSAFSYVASQTGTSIETVEGGIRKMQKALEEAAGGSKEAVEALAALNLTVDDLRGLTPDEQFITLGDAIGKLESPSQRAALAMQLFGRTGTELLPMFAEGASGINELIEKARELGLILSTQDVMAAGAFNDKLSEVMQTVKAAAFSVGSALVPALTTVANITEKAIAAASNWIREHKGVVVWAAAVGGALVVAGGALFAFGTTITWAVGVVTAVGTALATVWSLLGAIGAGLGAVVTSPLLLAIGAVVGLGAAFAYMSGAAGRVVDWLGGRLGAMKDVAIEAFHGIADALMAGDIETAAKILWVSLKIAWEAGLKTLRWDALKRAAVDTYFGVQEGFADFVFELQKIWFSAIEAMKAAWEGLKNITKNFIEDEANKSAKMGVVAKLAAGQITQEEARKQVAYIDRQSDDAKAANDMSAGAAIAAAENAKNEAIKKAAAAHDKHISEISDSASHAQASVVNGPTDEEKLAALQKELAALLAKARSESGNYGNAMPNGGMPPDLEDLVPGIKSAAKSLGTFSGAAAQGIFGGSVQDHIKRTAKATEEMVKLMKKPVVHQAIVRVG